MVMYDIVRLQVCSMCQPTISKLIERNREHLNTISGEDLLLILTEIDGLRIETSSAVAHPFLKNPPLERLSTTYKLKFNTEHF
jgi:hypothetical protein